MQKIFNLIVKGHIGETVAVVGEKHIFALQVLFDRFETLSDISRGTGIGESNVPIVDITVEKLKVLASLSQDKIIGKTLIVVQEIILDEICTVTKAENKVFVTVMGIVLHDVPKDRSVPDVYHRLGDGFKNLT